VIRSHISTWTNVTLALAGPALVAVLGAALAPNRLTLAAHAIGLLAIVLITLGVYAWAILGEGYALKRLGFGQCSWVTPLLAIALTAFFVLVFGPIAYWVLAISGSQSFDVGIEAVSQLPTAYLILTIVIVAPAEELLYRGYAIARLSDLTGSWLLASIVSIVFLGLAHVPMWGWAPAATTIVSGGIVTAVYLWRQDILALILAHIATDLYGIVLAPYLARAGAN
jgi:membrane protease YdiL (CAAX protease family)